VTHDSRDGGGRATHGAVAEGAKTDDYMARIVPDNPTAFPPLHTDVQVPRSPWKDESGHPWRSDGGGRAKNGAHAEGAKSK